jgi:predicted acyltransferase
MDKSKRLMSLDALRGADMLCIMGGASLVTALCTLFGAKGCWLATQMTHVSWHGFRQHDTIFPLFLFLAGVSWPFSLNAQRERGRTTGQIICKIFIRMLMLIFLGFATSTFFSFNFSGTRYANVLGHIGIGWAVAALLSLFVRSTVVRLCVLVGILVGYWALLAFVSAPDAAALLASTDPAVMKKVATYAAYGTDGFSFTGNIVGWFDRRFLPGKMYELVFDPEGLLSSIPVVATGMLGVFAGELLRRPEVSGKNKTLLLVAAAAVSAGLSLALARWCPINKKLWTPTFVLAAGGYSFAMLALFYWIIDVKGWRRWTFFFRVIGMNSITIYLLMRIVPFNSLSKFFFSGVAGLGSGAWPAVVLVSGQIIIEWLLLLYLYRKETFLRV